MRHIPDGAEPRALAEYRQSQPMETWENFRNHEPTSYDVLVEYLEQHQRGLCAYCEIDLTPMDRQVEHFHPKKPPDPAHNWALDFSNLTLACKGGSYPHHAVPNGRVLKPIKANLSCGQAKGNDVLAASVLHPREIPAFPPVFGFDANTGELLPDKKHCEQTGVPAARVQATINAFNLNCPRLNRARLATWGELTRMEQGKAPLKDLMEDFLTPAGNDCLYKFQTTLRNYFGAESLAYLPTQP